MSPDRLWAKSKRPEDPETPSMLLAGHLADVLQAADALLDATGDHQLLALGLDPQRYRDRLRRCVRLASASHDLGKANNHFQDMIRGRRNVRQYPQGLRHEWVTILILEELKPWLIQAVADNETDFALVEWAIAGHHPAPDHTCPPKTCPAGAGPDITILSDHIDVHTILQWFRQSFDLAAPPALARVQHLLIGGDSAITKLAKWAKLARRLCDEIKNTAEARFLAAVKACLIAADVAGSALPRYDSHPHQRWIWITSSFNNLPKLGDIQRVAVHRLKGGTPREFQQAVRSSPSPVTYVKAGCGSGKTLAAYLWAAANYPTRRLYFCYPTTGTATEGYKDYLFEPDGELGDFGARLFHSRRDVDCEIILGTGADSQSPESEEVGRRDALEAWSTPIVACTVDTVLGLMQNNKRGLFAWPALVQSAFVFDEIHAYDDRLFGALLRFLHDLPGLPCLLMTASLPKSREDALSRMVQSVHGYELQPILGPPELEDLPRYHRLTACTGDLLAFIEGAMQTGGKVLWVCNTVGRVMEAAKLAATLDPLIYHSRFRYEDRVQRHKEVVNAFTPEHTRPALAICSQVAEMSLDLKGCTMLVTDLAPVPSLIQRLGRLNRQAKPGDPTRPFLVLEPDTHLPYSETELDSARAWLERLPKNQISQRQLSECWEQSDQKEPWEQNSPNSAPSAWLDGGPTTTVVELREASPGITVLMEADRHRVRSNPGDRARYLLPMPPPPSGLKWEAWPRERGIPVAPTGTILYDPKRGAEWRK